MFSLEYSLLFCESLVELERRLGMQSSKEPFFESGKIAGRSQLAARFL